MSRANPRVLGSALFSALGLLPLACGGAFSSADGAGATSSGGSTGEGATGSGAAGYGTGGGKASGGSGNSAGKPSSGGQGGGGQSGGGQSALFPCEKPIDLGGGYERCDNGSIHRGEVGECKSTLPRPANMKIAPPDGSTCTSDADCTAMPNGFCAAGGQLPGLVCNYGCVKDTECPGGQICVCGEPVGHCSTASCASDADCGAGFRCQSYDSSHGCGFESFACQTALDTCGSDADCPAGYCDGANGSFSCVMGGCAIGRPFLVEGAERVAALTPRGDWLAPLDLPKCSLSSQLCARVAEGWARVGQLEHASVAAFARFALQLLQLGAPPELVEATTRAMADETRHARLAFAVASHFAGRSIGPAALDVARSLEETTLSEVVRLVVREGCVGETVAALEAREAAAHATDPALAELLAGVADDETRHAELAWRFVSWALEQAPRDVAALLRAELTFGARTTRPTNGPHSADEQILLERGLLSETLRAELRRSALEQVILPCAEALLARAGQQLAEKPVLSA